MSAERRRAPRQDIRWEALIVEPDGTAVHRCFVVNVSATGAKLIFNTPTDVPDTFGLVLSRNGGVRRQCELTWRKATSVGVRFMALQSAEPEVVSYVHDTLARLVSKN